MKRERTARLFVAGILIGLPLVILIARWMQPARAAGQTVEIHGRMAEEGGWTPTDLKARTGEALHLRLTSDDVMHGFAVGQADWPSLDVEPGKMTETTLTFDRPGKYVFYCTRWCGVNHWRMRGTIEVSGEGQQAAAEPQPLYAQLGLDIDAPHPAEAVPVVKPSPARGSKLGAAIPAEFLSQEKIRSSAPSETWQALRADPSTAGLTDEQVWDLTALAWRRNTSLQDLEEGRELYAQNCAACHGEGGGGDGVMADQMPNLQSSAVLNHAVSTETAAGSEDHSQTNRPANFTDPRAMLGASPALLQGKILRGGMGTGMPYWGPIFTEDQTWALVDYLWTFQFKNDGE
jgi:mono/diheme cytochrome c family protein/plastocyanin